MLANIENSVAVVIDMQERLMPAIKGNDTILKRTEILVKGLEHLGVEVIYTQQYTRGLGDTYDMVKVDNFSFIEKTEFGAMEIEQFKEAVSKYSNVIITGVESHICVMQTALGLKEAGYNPIVVVDCIGSRKDLDKEIALERLRAEGVTFATSESILFELLKGAKTSGFKEISQLIK